MAGMHSIIGGIIGAAAGAIIWVLVGYSTHYEVGWIAWAVGFASGFGVRFGRPLHGEDASLDQGVLAAVLAAGAIITAKYLVFVLLVEVQVVDLRDQLAPYIRHDQEGIIAGFASDAVDDALERGETIAWPPGVSGETASAKKDYPPEIWKQAEQRWQQLGPQKQEEEKNKRLRLAAKLPRETIMPSFKDAFSPWDILWFALALATAVKIGVGADSKK